MHRICQFLFLAVCAACCSRGDIVYTSLDPPLALWTWGPQVLEPVDFNDDGIAEITFGLGVGVFGVRAEGETRLLVFEPPPPDLPGPVEPLALGFEIGTQSEIGALLWFEGYSDDPGDPNYGTDFRTLVSCFTSGCSGRFRGQLAYMGVEFELPDGKHYGWVRLSVSEIVASGSVGGWAYETQPGVSILAGAIPEPSTILLFAVGGLALILCRMRSKNARAVRP